jgi:GT2 family glycosyltransferase
MVRASLIWLNYNSSSFIDIALRSIGSALSLDFDDYEVIVVDNASSDGSFERIRKFIEEKKPGNVRVKFVRSDVNRGYAGGMNLGWEARDPGTKYVAFLNNDLILEPSSLRELVDYMEGDDKIAAISGLIYLGDGGRIYSAGGYATDHWEFGGICWSALEHECPGINKPHYVTYTDGAYMLVKAETIRRNCPDGKPFIDETFLYIDDALLGLILWNKGYRTAYIPIKSGYHYVGLTIKSRGYEIGLYYNYRASTALVILTKTRFSTLRQLHLARRLIDYRLLGLIKWQKHKEYLREYALLLRGMRDGLKLAFLIKGKVGTLNLRKAPYLPVSTIDTLLNYLLISKPHKKPSIVTHEMLKLPELW